jgi:hypothetical protein
VRSVEFRRLLDEENALRVRFNLDQGQVIEFVVQFECLFESGWKAVIRYDTAHGFAHRDRLHPYDEAMKTRLEVQDYNEALTNALNSRDICLSIPTF